jgi:hypothetical protein
MSLFHTQSMRTAAIVMAGVVGLGALGATSIRAQQRPAAPENSPDVKAIVFEVANAMGMLRGLQQEDSILTLEQWMKGTMTVGTQKFDVPDYRISINYSVPGMRIDYRRQASGGQPQRQIEVVAGPAAWNEADRGKGATATRDRAKERLVHLWTTPMGIVKAARAAGPRATVKAAGGATVLSFPLPAPADDVTVNATLRKDASLVKPNEAALGNLVGTYVVRVETTGGVVSETTYAEYGDWNWEDYRADIMLPRRVTRKQGDTTWDLMMVNTNTYNPYVVMPVPDTVK